MTTDATVTFESGYVLTVYGAELQQFPGHYGRTWQFGGHIEKGRTGPGVPWPRASARIEQPGREPYDVTDVSVDISHGGGPMDFLRLMWPVEREPSVRETLDLLSGRGLAVFPLPAGGRVPERGWQKATTLTPDPADFPRATNIGVGCRASRVVVLDLDVPDGITSYESLCAQWKLDIPPTLTVNTPSGGRHVYFRAGEECTIGSASHVLRRGIDVRGPGATQGGYVVGPGSVVAGKAYTIAVDAPIAPLPAWLKSLIEGWMDLPTTAIPF